MKNKTTLAQLKIDFGMLYIVQLSDGRFVLFDGGDKREEHEKVLLDYLERKRVGERPVIAAWMFTHLDQDHVDNAFDILVNHADQLDVECLGISIPDINDFKLTEEEKPERQRYVDIAIRTQNTRLEAFEKAKAAHPNAEVWAPKCGEHRRFGDMDMHVLITAEERIPEFVYSHNYRSLVMKLTFDSGKTCMIAGDCAGSKRANFIRENFPPEVLKSDVFQVVHHGLYGGNLDLYQLIDPEICFWPTTEARFLGHELDRDGNPVTHHRLTQDLPFNAWLRDDSIRVRKHYHGEQNVEVDMADFSTTLFE